MFCSCCAVPWHMIMYICEWHRNVVSWRSSVLVVLCWGRLMLRAVQGSGLVTAVCCLSRVLFRRANFCKVVQLLHGMGPVSSSTQHMLCSVPRFVIHPLFCTLQPASTRRPIQSAVTCADKWVHLHTCQQLGLTLDGWHCSCPCAMRCFVVVLELS